MSGNSSQGAKPVVREVVAGHGELAAMVLAGLLTPLGEAGGRPYELTAGR